MTALRSLLKQPRFLIVASLTLALGIGAVTAIFSVVNGILLKPLPFPAADRLVNVWSHSAKLGYPQFPLSPDIYLRYERENKVFESMALFQDRSANLTGDGPPETVDTTVTTASYFPTLGVQPAAGRFYGPADDKPGAARVVVLSYGVWTARYGRDAHVAGRMIRLDGVPAEIIGVAAAALDSPAAADYYLPAQLDRAEPISGNFGWNAIARLAPGVRPDAAAAHLEPIVQTFLKGINSPTYRAFLVDGHYQPLVHLMKEDLVGDLEQPLWLLLGTVGMLLLIACANVANLLLVRAEGRQREMAVRSALGATRASLVRHVMLEALVLSTAGTALGIAAAAAGVPALLRLAPPTIPRLHEVGIDAGVLAFAAVIAAASAVLFGLVPALRYTRASALGSLQHGVRGGTDEPARRRARQALVAAQAAMAFVLLVGSGLLVRSFSKLVSSDLGFDPRGVMTFRIALPEAQYKDLAAVRGFVDRLIGRLHEIPGVTSAGAATTLPIAHSASGTAYQFDGQPLAPGTLPPMVHYKVVGPGYFDTMQIPVRRGRDYHSGDFAADARSVIVNQAIADLYWPGQDPVGKRLRLSNDATQTPPWFTVVGVVGNERQDGLRMPVRPLLYHTLADGGPGGGMPRAFDFVVRGRDLERRGEELRQAVWSIDRGLPVSLLRSMNDVFQRSIVEFTFTMLTLGLAAVMALLLGAVGLYGVLSYAVTLRTREIGIRLALGAAPARVLRSIVVNGVAITAAGLALGLAGALGLTQFLASLLFETTPFDPATIGAMAASLFAVALLASYLPARRAAAVSPMESMRTD